MGVSVISNNRDNNFEEPWSLERSKKNLKELLFAEIHLFWDALFFHSSGLFSILSVHIIDSFCKDALKMAESKYMVCKEK